MRGTKEKILSAALDLFASQGYEAVSVSDIAGRLGITKAALYKHYRSKRDIFDCILRRMELRDAQQAQAYALPEGTAEEMPEAYGAPSPAQIAHFAKAMFRYWTQDGFAARFRRMLALEQYRSPEMGQLYQQYLADGPLKYLTDLFAGLGVPGARAEAVKLYAPLFLLYSVYDAAEDKEAVLILLDGLMDEAQERLTKMEKEGRNHG